MNVLVEFRKLIERIRKGEETLLTLALRPLAFPNYWLKRKVKVLDEDWKFLIILDACRYDYFKGFSVLSGNLSKKISAGTHTVDWVNHNFRDRDCSDIVYISPTPQISRYKLSQIGIQNSFFHLEEVWNSKWSKELETVHPEKVNEVALKLIKKYPNRRFIIHYLQPHSPFIGSTSLGIFRWHESVNKGEVDVEYVKKAYVDNLKLVLDYVKELLPYLKGKIIITADHGEAFGELGVYAHYPRLYIKPLMEIPWLEINQWQAERPLHTEEEDKIKSEVKKLKINKKL